MWYASSIGRLCGSGNQVVEAGVVPRIINPSDPLGKVVFLVSAILGSEGLGVLLPKCSALLTGDTARVQLNSMLRLLPGHFGCLITNNQQVKKGVIV